MTLMETTYYLYIDEFGNAVTVKPNPDTSTLTDLQTGVDGWIDITTGKIGGFRFDIVINDEGLYRNDFGTNFVATYMAGQQIVGPVVITKSTPSGETIGLTIPELEIIKKDGLRIINTIMTMDEAVALRQKVADEAASSIR